jgi:hypothetical protein
MIALRQLGGWMTTGPHRVQNSDINANGRLKSRPFK